MTLVLSGTPLCIFGVRNSGALSGDSRIPSWVINLPNYSPTYLLYQDTYLLIRSLFVSWSTIMGSPGRAPAMTLPHLFCSNAPSCFGSRSIIELSNYQFAVAMSAEGKRSVELRFDYEVKCPQCRTPFHDKATDWKKYGAELVGTKPKNKANTRTSENLN